MPIRTSCFYLLTLACLLLVPAAFATPVECPTTGTYALLTDTNAGGGCMIADKTFSDFGFLASSAGGAITLTAADVTYLTVPNAPNAVGFIFNFALSALPGQSNDIFFTFLVSGPNITSNHLVMAGGALGDAVAFVAETYCLGGPISGCPAANTGSLMTYSFGNGVKRESDSVQFAPVQRLGIMKDINVTAGPSGFAHISAISEVVDQTVPEPATLFLSGASLMGVAMLSRRRISQR